MGNILTMGGDYVIGDNLVSIAMNISLSFVLGLLIATVYKKTHKGVSYSQSFTQTLLILTVISTSAMMVIGSSLAKAFGMAGALSIIRFRTVVKDPKDIGFVFLALVIGMACGTQGYLIAITTAALLTIIIISLTKVNFGSIKKHNFVLRYYQQMNLISNEEVHDLLRTYLKSCVLLSMLSHESGKTFEFSYNVDFISKNEQNDLLKELSARKGISNVYLLNASNDIE